MAKRKSKKPQEEDTSILLESTVSQSKKRINSHPNVTLALLFIIIFAVGASLMGWFCVQQQYSLDELSESFTTMQKRITNLQQVMVTRDAQIDTGLGVEERLIALEEAQKQAQEKAEVALATSEKLKNYGHYSQLQALHDEMDTRLNEIRQVAPSVKTLQALFKSQSEDFAALKESVVAALSSSSALVENVARLTTAVTSGHSKIDEQVASLEALKAQLAGQTLELNDLKESMNLHDVALLTTDQEMAAIRELYEAKQAMHAQALEDMLSSVQTTLDEQFSTSQTLRSSVMAQLQTFHTQLANSLLRTVKQSNEEGSAAEELISATAQDAAEVQQELDDTDEEDEQQDAEDEAGEEEEEEENNEDEEETTEEEEEEEQEDEEMTDPSEEQEAAAEEEDTEESVEEERDEEDSEEVVEREETVEAESAELDSEVIMDESEDDG
ncbi:neurofilament light polypeptide-like [Plectropomus leopardus]|uniref:neurofilament light polypeptide-like n=1 Tax=Plectropomus leopardus TaxID=160734 RepID=UPI001C4C782B|nr:neurofilament light polypeptide-like [Plectropomus leopardus]